jgi:hypothetical protein
LLVAAGQARQQLSAVHSVSGKIGLGRRLVFGVDRGDVALAEM